MSKNFNNNVRRKIGKTALDPNSYYFQQMPIRSNTTMKYAKKEV